MIMIITCFIETDERAQMSVCTSFRYAQVGVENPDKSRVLLLFGGNMFQRDFDGFLDILAQVLPVLLWNNSGYVQCVCRLVQCVCMFRFDCTLSSLKF